MRIAVMAPPVTVKAMTMTGQLPSPTARAAQLRDCAGEAIQAGVTPDQGDATALWAVAWRARPAAWMIRHRHLLEHVATAMALPEACNRARSAL